MASNGLGYDPNTQFGRVAYINGVEVDRPLAVVRMGYQRYSPASSMYSATGGSASSFAPFPLSPRWDWRGQVGGAVFAGGADSLCVVVSGETKCVNPLIALPSSWFGAAFVKQDFHGTLLNGKMDATGTLYRRARYYDPATGRFTQEDPIGLAGGLNLYGYADGDPVSYSDPFGLSPGGGGCALKLALLCKLVASMPVNSPDARVVPDVGGRLLDWTLADGASTATTEVSSERIAERVVKNAVSKADAVPASVRNGARKIATTISPATRNFARAPVVEGAEAVARRGTMTKLGAFLGPLGVAAGLFLDLAVSPTPTAGPEHCDGQGRCQ